MAAFACLGWTISQPRTAGQPDHHPAPPLPLPAGNGQPPSFVPSLSALGTPAAPITGVLLVEPVYQARRRSKESTSKGITAMSLPYDATMKDLGAGYPGDFLAVFDRPATQPLR